MKWHEIRPGCCDRHPIPNIGDLFRDRENPHRSLRVDAVDLRSPINRNIQGVVTLAAPMGPDGPGEYPFATDLQTFFLVWGPL